MHHFASRVSLIARNYESSKRTVTMELEIKDKHPLHCPFYSNHIINLLRTQVIQHHFNLPQHQGMTEL
jgi:hypothetical protein